MTHTGPTTRPGGDAAIRRVLRREVPATLGILADPRDFRAMRRYRSFTHHDHDAYLRHSDRLLRALASQHLHTTVALFDPDEYADYCSDTGLDADSPASRSRFTAELARRGPVVPCTGEPLADLLPHLVETTVRRATRHYATVLLTGLGTCADCGEDIGSASFDRASRILMRLLEVAGPGTHHLVCSVPAPDEHLLAVLHAEGETTAAATVDADESAEFVTVLAAGIALRTRGGVVLRTSRPGAPDYLHGWRLDRGRLLPLTAGEVFSAYCTDATTGDPLPPEPGVEYCAGFPVTTTDSDDHH
ncbi:hypothetical protein [Streptomyces genisteinicus]|uniref:Uncharacterized protein n=1 Tax=Streptomyces genisteinicus TaxID=2768068 RepID=A0A7H0HNW7_9ACTN|nr:hypothetical protein [Streptomyces genisteinicus]QNP62233.1 hypothetical protein IAG43_04335 [Streptomyces genisteinicus]